jgi:hypothetical protein
MPVTPNWRADVRRIYKPDLTTYIVLGLLALILGIGGAVALGAGSSPSFSFSSDEPGATFQCSLDGGTPAACTSPLNQTGLAPGAHTETIIGSFTVPTTPPPPPPSTVLLGSQTVQGTHDGSSAPASEAFGYTAGASGTAASVSVYLDSTDGAQVGLYADSAGKPGARLDTATIASNAAGWATVPLAGDASITSGTRYWIALGAKTGGTISYRDMGSGGSNLDWSGSGFPNPYSPALQWNSNPVSAYVSGTGATSTTTSTTTPTTTSTTSTTPTTTTSTTSTTSTTPSGNCPASTPNAPDSPDPWGGCWPGPSSTGVPAGTVLTRVPQDATSGPGWTWNASNQAVEVNSCNVTISGLLITGSFSDNAGNGTSSPATPCVTLKNSKVIGYVDVNGPLVMSYDEIDTADMPTYTASDGSTIQVNRANISYGNFYEDHVNNHGGNGPDHCDGNCIVKDSWEHGLVVQSTFHMNGIGGNGNGPGNKLTAIHDYINCGDQAATLPGAVVGGGNAGCSGDLSVFPDFNQVTLDAEYNYLAPAGPNYADGSQVAVCLYPGQGTQKPYPTIGDYIANNVFGRGVTGQCGVYGPIAGWDNGTVHQRGTDSGNVWGAGNRYDDGTPINP